MADETGKNALAGPPEPSMLEHAQADARDWWNGLAGLGGGRAGSMMRGGRVGMFARPQMAPFEMDPHPETQRAMSLGTQR